MDTMAAISKKMRRAPASLPLAASQIAIQRATVQLAVSHARC
jgi:hypothetical protein